jgi:retinol-binding protein 3
MITSKPFQIWVAISMCLGCMTAGSMLRAEIAAPATVTKAVQRKVVTSLIGELNDRYVFPDVARNVGAALRSDMRKGAFDSPKTGQELANLLTQRLRDLTRDKHLGVEYSAAPRPLTAQSDESPAIVAERNAARLIRMRSRNFSIHRVERLKHNIGYINVGGFDPAIEAAETVAAAMRFVAYTDVLIIDLRDNTGGYPDGVAQLESYFFDKRTHLNDMYVRKDGSIEQTWTSEQLAGPRYGENRPVYILTSSRTFSGGEDMAYSMQQLKRVTVVGETTGGGANPGADVRLDDHFSAFIPFARAINPITRDNWEGKGVRPDVASAADRALETAQVLALRKILAAERDPAKISGIQTSIVELESGH